MSPATVSAFEVADFISPSGFQSAIIVSAFHKCSFPLRIWRGTEGGREGGREGRKEEGGREGRKEGGRGGERERGVEGGICVLVSVTTH